MPQQRQHLRKLWCGIHPVGIGRARTGDRLDDQRITNSFGCFPDTSDGGGAGMPRSTDPGSVDLLFHAFLVTERHGLLDGQAGQSERFPDPRRKDHVRLPQALDLVDRNVLGKTVEGSEYSGLVRESHLFVVRQGVPRAVRQRRWRLVTEPDNGRAHGCQRSGEVGHLGRISRRDHHNVHNASTSSTRIRLMMRCKASRTTSVSGSRTMTYPSPS